MDRCCTRVMWPFAPWLKTVGKLSASLTLCLETTVNKIVKNVVEFIKKEDGPTAVEYAVMLALIIVVCIAAVTAIGTNSSATFSAVGSAIKTSSS
jgi:pilus assembly protein Flp/PilA